MKYIKKKKQTNYFIDSTIFFENWTEKWYLCVRICEENIC